MRLGPTAAPAATVQTAARRSIVCCVAGWLLATALAGCTLLTTRPPAPLSAALPEPRLVGTWSGRIDHHEVYLKVRQREGNLFEIAEFIDESVTYYDAYVTDIAGRRFANLDAGYTGGPTEAEPIKVYAVINYRFDGSNRLLVRFIAEKAMNDAIKAGRLKGKASDIPDEWPVIDDEPMRLVEFLKSTDAATLFEKPSVFTRTATR